MAVHQNTFITSGQVVVDPDHGYDVQFCHDQLHRGQLIKRDTLELLAKINQLCGVSARAEFTTRRECSGCGYAWEDPDENGLTVCCGEPVESAESSAK